MPLVTIEMRVRRYSNRHDFTGFQVLQRVTKILGVTVCVREIDREEVPSWAAIQSACLGSTEWKSRLLVQPTKGER